MSDVGMIQRGQHLGFALEAGQAVRMLRERGGQNFDGDIAVELGVTRPIDFAHAAGAELGSNAICADGGANHLFTGTRRRSSSKKFIKNVMCVCAWLPSGVSTDMSAAIRSPSGERS